MIKGSESLGGVLKSALATADGVVMYISMVVYFFSGAWLAFYSQGEGGGGDGRVLSVICFLMSPLIFLLYVSLMVFSSERKVSRYLNAIIILVVNFLFVNKFFWG